MSRTWDTPDDCSHCQVSRTAGLGKCPTCGRLLNKSGPTFELPVLPVWIDRPVGRWLRERDLHEIALYMACVPLLIALPMVSLAMFALRLRTEPAGALLDRWKVVLFVAGLNIAISVYLLGQISDVFWSVGIEGIKSLWDILIPDQPAPGQAQPIPV